MTLSRGQRHPLCPGCRYDLVATVDVGGRVCPECGEEFEPHELLREVRPGEWTEFGGVKKLAQILAIRIAIALPIWLMWIYLVSGGIFVGATSVWLLFLLVVHLGLGGLLGRIVWKELPERSGFDGLFPFVAAVAALAATLALGVLIIGLLGWGNPTHGALVAISAGFVGIVVMLPGAFFDD